MRAGRPGSLRPSRHSTPVPRDRSRDESGGVWIRVGFGGGVVFYAGLVVMLVAGFTAVLPFVVIPLVLVALIGANSLLGGPRRRQRPPARPIRPSDRGMVPPPSGGPKVNGRAGKAVTGEPVSGDGEPGPGG